MTRHLNDTSVTDIYELGGVFATMRDVHYEVKCWNSLIKSTTAGRLREGVEDVECRAL